MSAHVLDATAGSCFSSARSDDRWQDFSATDQLGSTTDAAADWALRPWEDAEWR
jgi:hypothetical protein